MTRRQHDGDGPPRRQRPRCGGLIPDDGGGDPGGGPGPGGPGPGGPACGPGVRAAGRALQQRPPDLAVPLATLLGLAERPGEIQGFGPVDPALARRLAAAAAASPRTQVCVTVTSPEGYATGHGCARPQRAPARARQPGTAPPATAPAGLPARLNLTIPATALPRLTSRPGRTGPWTLTPRGSPGPPDGYGTWTLTIPGGRQFTVRLDTVPTYTCDHRYQTTRLPARRQAPPPGPGPRRRLHLPALQPPRPRQRLRARPAVPPRRENLHVQRRRTQPRLPPGQTDTRLVGHPAETRLAPVDHPRRPRLHPRTMAIPSLTRYALVTGPRGSDRR